MRLKTTVIKAKILTLKLGRGFGMLLHNVHFERTVLGKSGLTVGALVRFLTSVRELVPLQVETVGEGLTANVTAKGTLSGVRPENGV